MRVAQTDLLLVVEPVLVIRAAADVEDPLLEAFLRPRFVVFVRISVRSREVAGEMRRITDYTAPRVDYFFGLVFEDIPRKAKMTNICIAQGHGLFQPLQFFECYGRLRDRFRSISVACNLSCLHIHPYFSFCLSQFQPVLDRFNQAELFDRSGSTTYDQADICGTVQSVSVPKILFIGCCSPTVNQRIPLCSIPVPKYTPEIFHFHRTAVRLPSFLGLSATLGTVYDAL